MNLRLALFALPFLAVACGKASSQSADSPAPAPAGDNMEILATDMVLGDPNAPVTLIEYASLTCPHCAVFNEQVIPGVKTKFIDTGKVKLVYREYPTPPANYSLIGSVLARCAAEKKGAEAFFHINDALFRSQREWIKSNPRAELAKVVSQAGMTEADMDACLERKEFIDIINEGAKTAMEKYQIQSTPSFVLGGKKMSYKTAEEFEQQLTDAIEKAGAKAGGGK